MKKNSKRYNEILKNTIKDKRVSAKEALELVKKNSTAKFDESIDVSLKINLKQSKGGDLSLRTVVNLPNGSGKKRKNDNRSKKSSRTGCTTTRSSSKWRASAKWKSTRWWSWPRPSGKPSSIEICGIYI